MIRDFISVNPYLSPRIAFVGATETEISVQDLHDTLRAWADDPWNMSFESLITSAGKEDLGGGVLVGITSTLLNTKLAFESRKASTARGTVTTGDSAGITLVDNTATFIASGVEVGAWVENLTDGSVCTVLRVVSETELLTDGLGDPSDPACDSMWEVGDAYKVRNVTQTSVSGGNLVATDENGVEMNAILPTAGTQVVRTSSSSATLQELAAIQYASFNGGVSVDLTSPYSGTEYPTGTPQQPVNNLEDALSIANAPGRGFSTFFVVGNVSLGGTLSFEHMHFVGASKTQTVLTVLPSADVHECEFVQCELQGVLDGGSYVRNACVRDLSFFDGWIEDSMIAGTITLSGSEVARIINCVGEPNVTPPVIDFGGSGTALNMRNFSGQVTLTNKHGPELAEVSLISGKVTVTATVDNGTVEVSGTGVIEDHSTGTAEVDTTKLINPENVADAVWHRTITLPSPRRAEEVLAELHLLMGLDPLKPLVVTPTTRKVDTIIEQTITVVGDEVTLTRS